MLADAQACLYGVWTLGAQNPFILSDFTSILSDLTVNEHICIQPIVSLGSDRSFQVPAWPQIGSAALSEAAELS